MVRFLAIVSYVFQSKLSLDAKRTFPTKHDVVRVILRVFAVDDAAMVQAYCAFGRRRSAVGAKVVAAALEADVRDRLSARATTCATQTLLTGLALFLFVPKSKATETLTKLEVLIHTMIRKAVQQRALLQQSSVDVARRLQDHVDLVSVTAVLDGRGDAAA